METNSMPKTYTVSDIAIILRLPKNAIYEMVRSENPGFPVKKIGVQYRIPKAAFDNWLEEKN